MGRNMVAGARFAAVRDPDVRQRVIDECLGLIARQRDAWLLRDDGSYEAVTGGAASAQQALIRRYAAV